MENILIIGEGKIAEVFIELLLKQYFSNNFYIIVSTDPNIKSLNMPTSFKYHNFDPTSEYKLTKLITSNLHNIFIINHNINEVSEIYKIIRQASHNTTITIVCESKDCINSDMLNDEYLNIMSSNFVMASKLIEKMPNIPLVAQGIGLNNGEIMQINIPFGSVYSYISVGSIRQRNWKIVGIYRKNQFLIAKQSMIIHPNDSLLVVGDNRVLNNIYKRINTNQGSFPIPFGIDIYVYIDFRESLMDDIDSILNDALWLHKKINNDKLVINIINPTDINKLCELKSMSNNHLIINIDYKNQSIAQKIEKETIKKVGLIIIDPNTFKNIKNRRILYKTGSPILKIGKDIRINKVDDVLVLLSGHYNHIQNIAYTILDIAFQLSYNIKLYEFEIDEDFNKSLVQYYEDIGRIFDKKLKIEQTSIENPILWLLRNELYIMQVIPFDLSLLRKKMFWFLNRDVNYLSLNINKNPQLLIPY